MRRACCFLLSAVCGCSDEANRESWIVSADACSHTMPAPRSVRVGREGTSEVFVHVQGGAKLVAYSASGALAANIALAVGAQDAARFADGLIVVGQGTPPDGGVRAPYVAFVDAAGKPRWVTRFSESSSARDMAVGVQFSVFVHEGTIAVTVSTTSGSVGVGGVSVADGLALVGPDGKVTAVTPIDHGEGHALVAFDRDGVIVGRTALLPAGGFSIAAFDLSAKPRWRHTFETGSLTSLARCLDGVVASAAGSARDLEATTSSAAAGPWLLRFDPSGGRLASTRAPGAGAVAACDARGIVAAGVMFGILMDPRFPPIGAADRWGSYLATFPFDGARGELREFGAGHTRITAIGALGDYVHVAGSYRGSVHFGASSVTSCASDAPTDDVFVARIH